MKSSSIKSMKSSVQNRLFGAMKKLPQKPPTKKLKHDNSESQRGPIGISASATWAREQRKMLAMKGAKCVDQDKWAKWKKAILQDDPEAKFFSDSPTLVEHSACSKPFKVKHLYDLARWRDHFCRCKARPTKAKAKVLRHAKDISKMPSLFTMGFGKEKDSHSEPAPSMVPCPGLTEVDDPLVPIYLRRTGAPGGGGRAIWVIATERFKSLFSQLTSTKKAEVIDVQATEHTWRNDHIRMRVFASSKANPCLGMVPREPGDNLCPSPCRRCLKVLHDRRFRNALNRPVPSDENYIYVNHRFRNQVVGELYARNVGLREIMVNPVSRPSPKLLPHKG